MLVFLSQCSYFVLVLLVESGFGHVRFANSFPEFIVLLDRSTKLFLKGYNSWLQVVSLGHFFLVCGVFLVDFFQYLVKSFYFLVENHNLILILIELLLVILDLPTSSISFLIYISQLGLVLADFDLIFPIVALQLSILSFKILQLELAVPAVALPL